MKQVVGRRVRRFGLTPQQFWVLVTILESDGPSLRDLVDRVRGDAPTISRVVAALVNRRLVRTSADPRDRRRSRLLPTAASRRMEDGLRTVAGELRRASTDGMSVAEVEAVRAGLRKLIANMDRLERAAAPRSRRARDVHDV